jgi:chitinase
VTFTFTRTPSFTPTPTPLRVNCAGPVYTSTVTGYVWQADQAYSNGGWGYTGGGARTTADGIPLALGDDTLYQSAREGSFNYKFDIQNGNYQVNMKFADIYWNNPGSRVFDISLEGYLAADNFDIIAASGGHDWATGLSYNVTVLDGQLNLDFGAVTNIPMISAIEIIWQRLR